ncbi:MAG: pyruvate, phosphate dikinase [Treponema sp.]|jgi:pyruvate,orthophosphate dikinase|nr:pyruvate, phosphate dikinase [Treponema sp.]
MANEIGPAAAGSRGRQIMEFACLGLPVPPGIILETSLASSLSRAAVEKDISALLHGCAGIMEKKLWDSEDPLLFKITVSPNLAVSGYPRLHNLGLVRSSTRAFAARTGGLFTTRLVLANIRGMLALRERIFGIEGKEPERKKTALLMEALPPVDPGDRAFSPDKNAFEYMDMFAGYFPAAYFEDPESQIFYALEEASRLIALEDKDGGAALILQAMIYALNQDASSGEYYSRNILTGEKKLHGEFRLRDGAGQSIEDLAPEDFAALEKIARTLEDRFKEIRRVSFVFDSGRLWLTGQETAGASVQAEFRLLLELLGRNIVDKAYIVKAIDPLRLKGALHPSLDPAGPRLPRWSGGIAGAPGAASGRAFFSSAALLEERKRVVLKGASAEESHFILVLKSSFAGDVKAIEASSGVLTAEGGYSAHALVVARQYGKTALTAPDLKIMGTTAVLGGLNFSEGDYITLDVPVCAPPGVCLGAAPLIEPDPAEPWLQDLIALAKGFIRNFSVRANAETPRDAVLALSLGAGGIGLCRTEHMFFEAGRIDLFRELLISISPEERFRSLEPLLTMQTEDFYELFKVMSGRKVSIRLLDAPLHEFLPRTGEERAAFMRRMERSRGGDFSQAEIAARLEALEEFNPMLGRRGCRIAVAFPEIYAMQVRAVFDAVYRLRGENIEVYPEILIPFVMSAEEFRLIAYGKKIEGDRYPGVADVEESLRAEKKAQSAPYSIGAMIELPAAALGAGDIARYAGFFSFGANDLTQTALGISRDDFAAFMPDYSRFGLIQDSPFRILDKRVKELILLAVERGKLTRPDLVCGFCGEQAADPAVLRFCINAGINYVSCSPYSVPQALLAAAQAELGS